MEGKDLFEAIKRDYVNTYSYRVCAFLKQLAPEEFNREFGSMENCVREISDDAEVWFNKWLPNYINGVIARVKGTKK